MIHNHAATKPVEQTFKIPNLDIVFRGDVDIFNRHMHEHDDKNYFGVYLINLYKEKPVQLCFAHHSDKYYLSYEFDECISKCIKDHTKEPKNYNEAIADLETRLSEIKSFKGDFEFKCFLLDLVNGKKTLPERAK